MAEVLMMRNSMELGVLSEKKWPGHKEEMNSLYYAEAWALNHFLYFGKDGKYRERYLKVVNEEMRCHSGFEVFLDGMGIGKDKQERQDFLELLNAEVRRYQKETLAESLR